MKTAYELAMERLNKVAPAVKLTKAQKEQLSELDSKYAAKIAEREFALGSEIQQAQASGDLEQTEKLEGQLAKERKKLQAELEEKKDAIRKGR